ncbi:MAG: hypothetical protein AAGG57_03100 [Pseudomonadota bacterium]
MFGTVTTIGLLTLIFGNEEETHAQSTCIRFSEENRQFLAPLNGSLRGSADPTPLGKMPYNIDFKKTSEIKTQGKSPTNGVAVHTWDFWYTDGGILMLDFHTTFGNSHAKGLCVTLTDAERGYLFSGQPSVPLDIWIKVTHRQSDFIFDASIYLHGKPHVAITSHRE